MTKKECAIVMAYTGVCMLSGKDLDIYYQYINSILGRPVWTHELSLLESEIVDKSKQDFLKLCETAE